MLSSTEIHGWMEYFGIFPFDDTRADIRHAEELATIVNIQGRSVKHPVEPEKFLPDYLGTKRQTAKERTQEEQVQDYLDFKNRYEGA